MNTDTQFFLVLEDLDQQIERFATRKPSYLDIGHGLEDRHGKPMGERLKPKAGSKAEFWWHHKGQMHYHPVNFKKGEKVFDVTHAEVLDQHGHEGKNVTHAGRIDHVQKKISLAPYHESGMHREVPSHVMKSLITRHPDYKIQKFP